jgi:hypothetical protein
MAAWELNSSARVSLRELVQSYGIWKSPKFSKKYIAAILMLGQTPFQRIPSVEIGSSFLRIN